MKAYSTVRRHLRELRRLIESPDADVIEKQIAYEVENAIRWARENVVAWPSPVQSVKDASALLRKELEGRR